MGHSFGGLLVRRFAALYPDEVEGVVLVDPMRTGLAAGERGQRPQLERGSRMAGAVAARFGLARLATTSLLCRSGRASNVLGRATGKRGLNVLDRICCEVGKMPREVWPVVAAHWSTPRFYRGLAAHLEAVPATVAEMHAADPVEGMPVVLLTGSQGSLVFNPLFNFDDTGLLQTSELH